MSIINVIMAKSVIGQPEPHYGMGATLLEYTDRNPATIVDVEIFKNVTYITVQEDEAKRIDTNGISESQQYEYMSNPNGIKSTFRKESSGVWQQVRLNEKTQRWNKVSGSKLLIGRREKYYDPSF